MGPRGSGRTLAFSAGRFKACQRDFHFKGDVLSHQLSHQRLYTSGILTVWSRDVVHNQSHIEKRIDAIENGVFGAS